MIIVMGKCFSFREPRVYRLPGKLSHGTLSEKFIVYAEVCTSREYDTAKRHSQKATVTGKFIKWCVRHAFIKCRSAGKKRRLVSGIVASANLC